MGEGNFPIPAEGKGRGEGPPQFEGSGRGRPGGEPGSKLRAVSASKANAPLIEASSDGPGELWIKRTRRLPPWRDKGKPTKGLACGLRVQKRSIPQFRRPWSGELWIRGAETNTPPGGKALVWKLRRLSATGGALLRGKVSASVVRLRLSILGVQPSGGYAGRGDHTFLGRRWSGGNPRPCGGLGSSASTTSLRLTI